MLLSFNFAKCLDEPRNQSRKLKNENNSSITTDFPMMPFGSSSKISCLGGFLNVTVIKDCPRRLVLRGFLNYCLIDAYMPQLFMKNEVSSMWLPQLASKENNWGNLMKVSSLWLTKYSFGSSITLTGSSSMLELLETIGNSGSSNSDKL